MWWYTIKAVTWISEQSRLHVTVTLQDVLFYMSEMSTNILNQQTVDYLGHHNGLEDSLLLVLTSTQNVDIRKLYTGYVLDKAIIHL